MKTIVNKLTVIAVLTVLSATAANAQIEGVRTQNTETGHYYQVWGQNSITWDDAEIFTATLPDLRTDGSPCTAMDPCMPGEVTVAPHLATITSSREDAFIETIRASAKGTAIIARNEIWIGGLQVCSGDPLICPPVGEGWNWLNGEGAISTMQAPLPTYSNWLADEPNDNSGPGSENHLAIGLRGTTTVGWNDEGQLSNIGGFIVEWGVPLPADDCVFDPQNPTGCVTILGQTLILPEESNPNNGTISFNSFEFRDPRVGSNGVCDRGVDGELLNGAPRETLRIFGDTGIGSAPGTRPEMSIPPYLCGSPDFVIVAVDSDNLVFEAGTVEVINDTSTVLPANFYPGFLGPITGSACDDPIVQDFPNFGDPQYQDISVWQDTEEPTKMLEVDTGVGGVGEFEGATGEFTNKCGTSRMRVRGASYFGIGFHIDFGPLNTWASNDAGNFGQFVALTRYKLVLLKQSVRNARSDRAISRAAFRYILRPLVAHSIRMLDRGRYGIAQFDIGAFLWFVENFVNYRVVPGENHNGEHLMRGSNIEFMLDVKVRPYTP